MENYQPWHPGLKNLSGDRDFQRNYLGVGDSDWDSIVNKPLVFPPSAHNHSASDITSGTLSDNRLSSSIPRLNFANVGTLSADGLGTHRFGPGSVSTVEMTAGAVRAMGSGGSYTDLGGGGVRSSGWLYLDSGTASSVMIRTNAANSNAVQFESDGSSTFYAPMTATSIVTGSNAVVATNSISLPNNTFYSGTNAAGTFTAGLIGRGTDNRVQIDPSGNGTSIGAIQYSGNITAATGNNAVWNTAGSGTVRFDLYGPTGATTFLKANTQSTGGRFLDLTPGGGASVFSVSDTGVINWNVVDTLSGPSAGTLAWSTPYAGTVTFSQGQSGQSLIFYLVTAEGKTAGFGHYDVAHANGRRFDVYSQPGVPITIRPGNTLSTTFNTDGSAAFAGAITASGTGAFGGTTYPVSIGSDSGNGAWIKFGLAGNTCGFSLANHDNLFPMRNASISDNTLMLGRSDYRLKSIDVVTVTAGAITTSGNITLNDMIGNAISGSSGARARFVTDPGGVGNAIIFARADGAYAATLSFGGGAGAYAADSHLNLAGTLTVASTAVAYNYQAKTPGGTLYGYFGPGVGWDGASDSLTVGSYRPNLDLWSNGAYTGAPTLRLTSSHNAEFRGSITTADSVKVNSFGSMGLLAAYQGATQRTIIYDGGSLCISHVVAGNGVIIEGYTGLTVRTPAGASAPITAASLIASGAYYESTRVWSPGAYHIYSLGAGLGTTDKAMYFNRWNGSAYDCYLNAGGGNLEINGSLSLSTDTRFQRPSAQTLQTQVYDSTLAAWQESTRSQASASGAKWSVLGATPIMQQTLPAAATDAATTQSLCNAIRTLLLNFGFSN